MKIISKTLKLLPLFLLMLGLNACSDDDDNTPEPMPMTIVDVAVANNFNALAAALERANLVTTLQGTGPFTVFAPTDEAFQALLDSNPDWNSLSDIDIDLLTNVLLNHVIIGTAIPSNALVAAGSGYTTTGATGPDMANLSLYYNVVDGTVELNGGFDRAAGADVTTADVAASNGIIHIINKVLLPPTLVDFALANPTLSNLVAALTSADSQDGTDLISTLSGTGPFTVFAPTDDAFAALLLELDESGETTLGDVAPATVEAILLMHVVSGSNVRSTSLGALNGTVPTLGGDLALDGLTLTDGLDREIGIIATLVDIQGVNGVVHAVDKVIRPAN